MVYVDDFKMSGPSENLSKGWQLIRKHTKTDKPLPAGKCLGCDHQIGTTKVGGKSVKQIEYDMQPFLEQCVQSYLTASKKDRKTLKKAATPFLDDNVLEKEQQALEAQSLDSSAKKGVLQPIAASILMKVLYAARLARFDLLKAVGNLASKITKWDRTCDRQLHRLVSSIDSTLE